MALGLTQPVREMSKGGQCAGLTTLPPSCAYCLEIWEAQPPGTLRVCTGIAFYRVSQEECEILRESVPYVKVPI